MGCFGYICKGCGTHIAGDYFTGGEKIIMKHIRHGKIMGQVEGSYDEYGRVTEEEGLEENKKFRGDHPGINGHKEICKSEFDLEDSRSKTSDLRHIYGNDITYHTFLTRYIDKEGEKEHLTKSLLFDYLKQNKRHYDVYMNANPKIKNIILGDQIRNAILELGFKDNPFYEIFKNSPPARQKALSGIAAWHQKCYNELSKEEKQDITPSKADLDQAQGQIRASFL